MTLSADQVESKVRSRNEVHFKLALKVGKLSSSTSETIPMPADARGLSDVLKVPIQSGEHKCRQATKLATMKGVTYTLVVTGPR